MQLAGGIINADWFGICFGGPRTFFYAKSTVETATSADNIGGVSDTP